MVEARKNEKDNYLCYGISFYNVFAAAYYGRVTEAAGECQFNGNRAFRYGANNKNPGLIRVGFLLFDSYLAVPFIADMVSTRTVRFYGQLF